MRLRLEPNLRRPTMGRVKIAVIGAGPAGIYTSLLLADLKGSVTLFEQNQDVGEKLKTTGGGRMNVTNKVFSATEFSSNQPRFVERLFKNPHFEYRYDILEALGIEYQWEKHRAILQLQDAVKEVARLKAKLEAQGNLTLRLNTKIVQIENETTGFKVCTDAVREGENFDRVVLTIGGMYRMRDLGPKEKIYQLPLAAGHQVTDVGPSLCPLIFIDKPLRAFSGISFVGRLNDTATGASVTDDMLITHFGISGPAALDFSALNAENATLSFITEITEAEFKTEFNALRSGKNSIRKMLKPYLPQRLVDFHLERAGIAQDFIADLPKAQLNALVAGLFAYPLPPRQANVYPASWTTKGGVSVDEVHTKNLESKLVPGLHFAGEVLDFNGLCGGYNISFAMVSAAIVADDLLAI